MPFITQGKTNIKYILIIVFLAAIVGGGILAYQYCWLRKEENPLSELKLQEVGLNLKTTKLATMPEDYHTAVFYFSQNGRNVAYQISKQQHNFVVLNDKKGKTYSQVDYLTFNSDGSKLIYRAAEDTGRIEEPINLGSPGGIYIGGKYFMLINEEEKKSYDYVFYPVFNSDSNQLAYVVRTKEGKEFIVLNDNEGSEYEYVSQPMFSSDGKQLAFIAGENIEYIWKGSEKVPVEREYWDFYGKFFAVINGQKGKTYDEIWDLKFSPDGSKVVYIARIGKTGETGKDKYFIVINEQEDKTYDYIPKHSSLTFSPDGAKVAYVVEPQTGERKLMQFVVINDKEGPAYKYITGSPLSNSLVFSPDSKKLAYSVSNDSYLHKVIITNDEGTIIEDGKEYLEVNMLDFVFSSDSKHTAYAAKKRGPEGFFWIMVIDGKEDKEYDYISRPVFSPDNKHFAYVVKNKGENFIVIDEKEGKPYVTEDGYGFVSNPVFSPDSKYIAYGAKDGNELWWIVEPVD